MRCRQRRRDRGEIVAGVERLHPAVIDDVGELVGGGSRREGDDDRADLAGGEEEVEDLDAVEGEETEAVAWLDAVGKQCGRGALGARVEIGVRIAVAGLHRDQRELAGCDAGAFG